jgi:hypothetical protein
VASHTLFLDLPRRVAEVRAEDVARLARARLRENGRTVGVLLPAGPSEVVTAGSPGGPYR